MHKEAKTIKLVFLKCSVSNKIKQPTFLLEQRYKHNLVTISLSQVGTRCRELIDAHQDQ